MSTPITAQNLLDTLVQLQEEGNDLNKITINFRTNWNSDTEVCTTISEDLFDAETGNQLESLVLLAEDTE
jgi:hypothetical protein